MRKSYVVCAVLLVVSLLAGLTLASVAAAPIDKVEVELRVVDGDPAAAEGLVLSMVHDYENLFWKSRIELGPEPTILSDFRWNKESWLNTDDASREWLARPLSEGDNWLLWEQEDEQEQKLSHHEMHLTDETLPETRREEIVSYLAWKMGPKKEETFEIYLKDYVDYYAERVVDDGYYSWYYSDDFVQLEKLDDLIRRPVEEDFCVAVTIRTDSEGGAMDVWWDDNYYYDTYGERPEGDPRPITFGPQAGEWLISQGVEGGTFLAVGLPEPMKEVASAEWFPRGWGLFYVPRAFEPFADGNVAHINGQRVEGVDCPQYDKLELVMPLTWGEEELAAMRATPDGRCLQAVVRRSDGLWLISVAADDRQNLRQQKLPEELVQAENVTLLSRDEFLIVCGNGSAFAVYTLEENGAAHWQFTTDNPYAQEEVWHGYWTPARTYGVDFAYCDGKLAVCGGDLPWVQVYDETGLLCTAEYRLSLNGNNAEGQGIYAYYRWQGTGAQLRWQEK